MNGTDGSSLPRVGSRRRGRTFDVFISFRGDDTRNNFTSFLGSALYKKQIDVFIDNRLERGDEISEALMEAIKGSKLSLVVLSENYAFSRWCLDELLQVVECKKTMGQLVIPIFYNVDPSHVRWQRQSFAAAFAKHEERYNMEKVKRWRAALEEVANLSGHNSSAFTSDSELVDAVVRDTVEKLSNKSYRPNLKSPYPFFGGLIGINSRMEKVLSLLDIGVPDFRIVGIWGMGGIGKTTVAEAIFNQIKGEFEGFYFFSHVRTTEEKGDLVKRRDEILSKLLEEEYLHIGTSYIQPSFVFERLRRKRVLVVLDDVNNRRQLENFFGGLNNMFSAESRVIITTRDRQVLRSFEIRKVYDVEKLNDHEALQLFRQNASLPHHQIEAYDKLSQRLVHYASGNPLVLKVFACHLHGKDRHDWESALSKLGRVPKLKIRDKLKVSYDGLEDQEIKNIFLDIAFFFKGQDKDQVASLLNGYYHAVSHGIRVLVDNALITIRRNEIEMPDSLQELGWDIVKDECESEPGKRTRLWRPEDVYHILKRNTGTESIRGIFGDLSKMKEVNICPDVFKRMYNLRWLIFHGSEKENTKVHLPRGLASLPDELRYLCWHGCPLKCLPPAFCPENLVKLDMPYSNLEQLWSGTQNLGSLKILNLAYSAKLKELPDLSGATNLEQINLEGSCQIEEVPSSIQHLSRLVDLYLRNCVTLKKLQDTFSSLDSLETLVLSGCRNIEKLPHLPGKLKFLYLRETGIQELSPSIGSLPSDIWKLQSLKVLDLYHCSKLAEIPEVLESNECLERIDLSGTAIRELPSSIERLVRLGHLRVDNCRNLTALPETLWNLENLIEVFASETAIKELPPFKKDMTKLTMLFISGCDSRDPVPLSIPPPSRVRSLYILMLIDLHIVQIPEDIGCLTSLRTLNLMGNDFKTLPASIKNLSKLEVLCLDHCTTLE